MSPTDPREYRPGAARPIGVRALAIVILLTSSAHAGVVQPPPHDAALFELGRASTDDLAVTRSLADAGGQYIAVQHTFTTTASSSGEGVVPLASIVRVRRFAS